MTAQPRPSVVSAGQAQAVERSGWESSTSSEMSLYSSLFGVFELACRLADAVSASGSEVVKQ